MSAFNNRILKEIKNSVNSDLFKFVFDDEGNYGEKNFCYLIWRVIDGLYKNQTHVIQIKFTYGPSNEKKFPKSPPNMIFLTPIFHTNISTGGSICVDILKEGQYTNQYWSPMYGIDTVFNSIILLLEEQNTSSPFNGDASRVYRDTEKKREKFEEICLNYYVEKISNFDSNTNVVKLIDLYDHAS